MELKLFDEIEFTFRSGRKQTFKIVSGMNLRSGFVLQGINLSGKDSRATVKIAGRVAPDQNGENSKGKA